MQQQAMNPDIRNTAQDLIRRQRIAQAVAIAECGHAHKALAMVESVPTTARHAEDWDLMARLLTRMSQFREARNSWEEAERAGMSPELVRNAITALAARRHVTLIAIFLLATAAAMAALLAIIVIFTILF
jgi:cytochrome c-type biogenesis protein CcmH/NrfG